MLSIALVQCKVPSTNPRQNLEHMLALVDSAAEKGPDLIVLPELCTFQYFCGERRPEWRDRAEPVNGTTMRAFAERAQVHGCNLIVPTYQLDEDNHQRYNAATVLDGNGDALGSYRKLHVPDLPGENANVTETYYFAPGDHGLPIFEIGEARLGILICWDRNFPEAYRSLVRKGANLIVVVSATARGLGQQGNPWAQWQYDHWSTTLKTMALLNGVFVAAVNRVGKEGVFDYFGCSRMLGPWGNELAQGPADEEEIILTSVDLGEVGTARERLPFLQGTRPEVY